MEKDLSTWTKAQLQAQLRKLGLKISGNKDELIERIHGRDFLTGILDVDREILLNLNTKDLLNTCKTDKYAARLCSDEKFLELRVDRQYKGDTVEALTEAVTYGDLSLVKYLHDNDKVPHGDYNNIFWKAYDSGYVKITRYILNMGSWTLVELLQGAEKRRNSVNAAQYIIEESGYFDDILDWDPSLVTSTEDDFNYIIGDMHVYRNDPELLEYLMMIRHLYVNLENSMFLNVLHALAAKRLLARV